MPRPSTHRSPRSDWALRQTGVSLIEVLVALLVLSIGLLGLAALQAQSLRYNHDSMVRTQATTLALEITDLMRTGNPQAFAIALGDPLPAAACDMADVGSSVDEMLRCWLDRVGDQLPFGTASIVERAGAAGTFDIQILWLDREPREFAGEAQPRLPTTQNECESLVSRQWLNNRCMLTQIWTVVP